HLSSQSGPRGHAVISVEEYKRPKFQVRLKQPSDGARLDASLQVEGTAISYTEAPVDGAKVSWRITRQRSLRPWPIHSRGYMPPGSPARVVARGQTVTRTNGSFVIEFTPRTELSEANLEDPVFHFEVHADVTDASGETQSDDTTLKLANRALDVRTTIDPFLTLRQPKEIQVHTESLDGVPLPRKGTLRVRPLRPPEKIERIRLVAPHDIQPLETPTPNDWRSWPAGDTTSELPFATDATGKAGIQLSLTTGAWRITASAEDRFGRTVEHSVETLVIDETAPQFDLPISMILNVPKQSYRPGEVLEGFWGSGYKPVRALVEWMHEGRTVSAQWTERGISQAVIRRPITEAMKGSLTLRVTQVRDNRSFVESRLLEVAEPHPPLELQLVDLPKQLRPGNRENWTVKIHRPEGAEKRMEAVAVLYDASLDAFRTHSWPNSLRIVGGRGFWDFVIPGNQPIGLHPVMGQWPPAPESLPPPGPREWADDLGGLHNRGGRLQQFRTVLPGRAALSSAPMAMESGLASPKTANAVAADAAAPAGLLTTASGKGTETPPKLTRRVFQETAFFLPALEPDAEGKIQIPFTVPDTLTEWRLMIVAHDKSAATGFIEARVATSKDLMVQPNPPRFLREQDELEFTTRVINTTDATMTSTIRLHWHDAGGKPLTQIITGRFPSEQSMEIPARESRTATWGIRAPTGVDTLTFRTEATAGNSFDAEEGTIPVLPRRVLTSESLAVLLPKAGTRESVLTNLLASKSDARIEHASLQLELTSQPAWQAVLSLPYLMEFPHECAEQIFHRYYANSLALHLLKTEPGVAEAFRAIRQAGGGASPLLAHSNKTFMTSLPQDTPWLAMGLSEANRRMQLSKLFDDGSLSGEMKQALEKLEKLRTADGLWPWFSGGPANPQITLCIAAGFGKLKAAGVSVPMESVQRAWQALDRWIVAESRRLQGRTNGQLPVLNSIAAQYLYGRSFFLRELPLPTETQQIVQEWLGQADRRWTDLRHRQSQAQLALALHRWGRQASARAILKSLRERSVSSDDEGMYWRDAERRGVWEEAPIETQALMIEAFEQIEGDRNSVESCKLWLLRQKQVQSWETTKATADAVHVLIRSGTSWLSTSKPASVELGGKPVVWNSSNQELPGQLTRGYESGEITPDMGRIKISKLDEGPAWGALHWVYTTDAEKVEAAGGGGLGLQRRFFVRRIQNGAASLLPLQGPVAPGDEIISRIEISVNEDMEFVHLRDPRPSGTEPTTVLSGYRWSGGLGYYVSTRDTASHFYFERLPKGRHVVEHSMRVQLRGRYQAFAAEIQCMYAPEFRRRAATTFIDCR
ncbi:MAG: hypothetical protein FJ405_09475, partial [Verrucomicrobia bacterium]|nr:hypothetical protein [Verrucomicrobiota bacterium]